MNAAVDSGSRSPEEVAAEFLAENRKLIGQVRIEDIQVPIETLRQHLQRPEFFDGEQYPTIPFEAIMPRDQEVRARAGHAGRHLRDRQATASRQHHAERFIFHAARQSRNVGLQDVG